MTNLEFYKEIKKRLKNEMAAIGIKGEDSIEVNYKAHSKAMALSELKSALRNELRFDDVEI